MVSKIEQPFVCHQETPMAKAKANWIYGEQMPKVELQSQVLPMYFLFLFSHHCLPLTPTRGRKRWEGWNTSQDQSMIRQHDGEAASAVEKGWREIQTCNTSAGATAGKLSQYHTIMCSDTGIQAIKLLPAAAVTKAQTYRLLTIPRKKSPSSNKHTSSSRGRCLVPLIKHNLTRTAYSANGFHDQESNP